MNANEKFIAARRHVDGDTVLEQAEQGFHTLS
jgi:hypothetical protein